MYSIYTTVFLYLQVTSSKSFEDRATHILNEMRKQRRSLQLEYVAKVKFFLQKRVNL